mmetsp:Transcript_27869/g.28131  ORF Transcript_27869/g.28131 Transcript_27869/m.28131 type:complete len:231 (-) Transcript_27869:85-777(-)
MSEAPTISPTSRNVRVQTGSPTAVSPMGWGAQETTTAMPSLTAPTTPSFPPSLLPSVSSSLTDSPTQIPINTRRRSTDTPTLAPTETFQFLAFSSNSQVMMPSCNDLCASVGRSCEEEGIISLSSERVCASAVESALGVEIKEPEPETVPAQLPDFPSLIGPRPNNPLIDRSPPPPRPLCFDITGASFVPCAELDRVCGMTQDLSTCSTQPTATIGVWDPDINFICPCTL